MTSPVLFVVDDDTGSLGTLDGTLRRRYGAITWSSPNPPPKRPWAACGSCGRPTARWPS